MNWKNIFIVTFHIIVLGYLYQQFTENPGTCPYHKPSCYYSDSYYHSRTQFLEKAKKLNAEMHSKQIKNDKVDDLTIDVAILNKPTSENQKKQPALVHISGTHGVEGYTGAAIQLAFLDQLINGESQVPEGVTMIIVHAYNPFGFLFNRRWNENQVDLNRNVLPEDIYPGELKQLVEIGTLGKYRELDGWFNLDHPWINIVDDILYWIKAVYYLVTRGFFSIKSAAVTGQYYAQDKIWWGGDKLQASPEFLINFLREQIPEAEATLIIDVHTGIGPEGIDTLMGSISGKPSINKIFNHSDQKDKLNEDFLIDATFKDKIDAKDSSSANESDTDTGKGYELLKGSNFNLAKSIKAKKGFVIMQEFGTVRGLHVLKGMIKESSYWNNEGTTQEQFIDGAQAMKSVFYRENAWYKGNTIRRGLIIIKQALQGLNNPETVQQLPEI